MSLFKDGRVAVNLDKERHLLFTLNALDEIQDRFGSIEKIGEALDGKDGFKNLRYLLTLLINQGDMNNELLSEQEVGKLIHIGNIGYIKDRLSLAFATGSNGNENTNAENEEDEEKNAETAMLTL